MAPRLQSKRHPSQAHHIAGPLSFFNPTEAYVGPGDSPHPNAAKSADGDAKPANGGTAVDNKTDSNVYHLWRSRDNRKGRHAVIVFSDDTSDKHDAVSHPNASASLKEVIRGIWKMFVRYPVWDVSYDVAILFTLGRFSVLSYHE